MVILNNIIKQKKLKISYLKNEYKYMYYRFLIRNKNVKPITQSYIRYKMTIQKKKSKISYQKRVCLILSKHRSVYPKINLKRHTIKKLNATADIPNLTISKW